MVLPPSLNQTFCQRTKKSSALARPMFTLFVILINLASKKARQNNNRQRKKPHRQNG
jgi:hypothetical protein